MQNLKPQPIKLAVFDIDGTVFRSSLTIELINQLVADKIFPKKALKDLERDYVAWLNRKGSYEDYLAKVVEIYHHYLKGCKVSAVDSAIKKVIISQKDQVYRFTRDLIKELYKQKYFLIAISGSSINIVEPFSRYFKFNAYHGRIYEAKNGRYTGVVLNQEVMNKDKSLVLKSFLKENGIKADWRKSIVVGDTETEIPLLRLVGQPIAFNPNMTLTRYAVRHNWRIVVERKDVVFELTKFKVIPVKGK